MSCASQARKLADYIKGLRHEFEVYEQGSSFSYHHIGALYTDIILQAGLNYNSVVRPRVQRVLLDYPEYVTVQKFLIAIEKYGLEKIINWSNPVKLERFLDLIDFSVENNIDNCSDLKSYLSCYDNQKKLLEIKGIGFKTLDYLMKLLNIDNIAVDRHIYSFVKLADINVKGYKETKMIVEYAADFLNISRTSLDKGIWIYMSEKRFSSQSSLQYSFDF